MQQVGLHVLYRENQDVRAFVCKTATLAFVPVRYVQLAWQAAKAQVDNIQKFVNYFRPQDKLETSVSLQEWNFFL